MKLIFKKNIQMHNILIYDSLNENDRNRKDAIYFTKTDPIQSAGILLYSKCQNFFCINLIQMNCINLTFYYCSEIKLKLDNGHLKQRTLPFI